MSIPHNRTNIRAHVKLMLNKCDYGSQITGKYAILNTLSSGVFNMTSKN